MKPKTMILMVVAVTCGLGASYMTSRLLAERQPLDEEKVEILVAKKKLDMGMTIKNVDDLFEIKRFTRGEEPKNAVVDKKDLQGRVLKVPRREGDSVSGEDLLSADDVGISSLMAQGYRAIGIRVTPESIASGFASLPLSRVDLIWTVKRTNDKDSFSQVLLENVLVLAADTRTVREGGNAMPANVVTVALKPEDDLKIAMAREMGSISLVLRKFNDHQKAEVTKLTVEELISNTVGRNKEGEDGSITEDSQQPQVAKNDLPPLPKDTQAAEAQPKAEAHKGTLHRLHLIEGDKERVVEYWLDDNGEVLRNNVVRSEIPPAPPRVGQTQQPY
jgi:pilus assembly protein CpaB